MQPQVLHDLLSEILMLQTGGAEWYRVAGSRAAPDDQAKFEGFMREAIAVKERLIKAIRAIGGDPHHIAPVAKVAQYTGESLMNVALVTQALTPEERQIVDLEVTIALSDQCASHWQLLATPGGQGFVARAAQKVTSAVGAVVHKGEDGAEQDPMAVLTPLATQAFASVEAVLLWARTTWVARNQALLASGLPQGLVRPNATTFPEQPVEQFCSSPVTEGLLEGAGAVMWLPSPLHELPKV